ncbi:hypothetical protein D3C72_1521360 [compost metagenome]
MLSCRPCATRLRSSEMAISRSRAARRRFSSAMPSSWPRVSSKASSRAENTRAWRKCRLKKPRCCSCAWIWKTETVAKPSRWQRSSCALSMRRMSCTFATFISTAVPHRQSPTFRQCSDATSSSDRPVCTTMCRLPRSASSTRTVEPSASK